jgi:hypothetical protein
MPAPINRLMQSAIQVDATVTVFFNSTAPSLTGLFKGFRDDFNFFIIQDSVDPLIEHLVKDFAYVTSNGQPPAGNIDIQGGELIEVTFDNQGPNIMVTGTVTAVDPNNAIIVINDGFNDILCKDYWTIKRL